MIDNYKYFLVSNIFFISFKKDMKEKNFQVYNIDISQYVLLLYHFTH